MITQLLTEIREMLKKHDDAQFAINADADDWVAEFTLHRDWHNESWEGKPNTDINIVIEDAHKYIKSITKDKTNGN